ncbi:MAG: DNA gyrase subunit A [Actinobacteria bacterium]|nr:DNA gyrase subunit A [Actinomycetota bacterium]
MIDLVGGRVELVELEDEMQRSYMEYAMSVIAGRALPDVRDGLKPVHRRILYSMQESGLTPNNPHRKCARVVGDVMGRYHPHGDAAVYDTLVRMAQDFSYRYELVDGHGNFGSVDGDNAAAMRYTEARLEEISLALLEDIKKDTVDFVDNYDGSMQEPVVLPSKIPNLLTNGSSGIAVGMATNVPPHNLGEVVDATRAYIEDNNISVESLMEIIPGPDFPTGGLIMGSEGIKEAYTTGRGLVQVRARAHVEQIKTGKQRIVVTEIPFQVNKSKLAEKIADLVKNKTITEISDLRDESDRSGMRLVIELKRDAEGEVILNQLYKHTQMQNTFGIIFLALVDGVPKTLSVLEIIRYFVKHRKEVVTRRTKFELERAKERAHILEGLVVALDNLDAVIKLIRGSKTVETAREGLINEFKLTEKQAQAILDMRLQRLTGMEMKKVKDELEELVKKIEELKAILADPKKVLQIIDSELVEIKEKFNDERRSEIVESAEYLSIEDLIAEEEMVITITHTGYAKRVPVTTFRNQRRGGRGVTGMDLKEGDFVEHLFIASTHHFILFFSNKGKVYRLKVHELPTGSRISKGKAMVNLLPLEAGEKIVEVIATKDFSGGRFLVTATKRGIVKKTRFELYDSARRDGIIALKLNAGDEMIRARLTEGNNEMLLVSSKGKAIKFHEEQCRPMGRTSIGVKGMTIDADDGGELLTMEVTEEGSDLFVITGKGYGKRTSVSLYPVQNRGGKGVKTITHIEGKGDITGARTVRDNQELLIVSQEGIVIRSAVNGIPRMGRATQGVKVMKISGGDRVSAVALVVSGDDRGKPEEEEQEQEELQGD